MLRIERLSKIHNRKQFDCNQNSLNNYLKHTARQHADREISRTFVLVDDNEVTQILGYFTLTVCEIVPADISDSRLQRYPHPIPVAKLARLAVAGTHQKKGHGKLMLIDAMRRTIYIAENVGLVGMVVDVINQSAVKFYKNYDFIEFENNPLKLFLSLSTIQKIFN